MLLKQKVMSGLAWSAGGRFLAQLVTWSITIFVIRLLSPEDYGLMSLAMVFVGFLAMLGELGLGAAVVQRRHIPENILRSLFSLVLLVSIVFYALLYNAAPLISGFYDEPRLTLLIRVLALEFLLIGFSVIPQSLLQRNMEFRKLAVVNFFSALTGSITTLTLALSGYGVWSLVWGTLVIRASIMVGMNLAHPFIRMPGLDMKGMLSFFAFGTYVTLSRITWYFYSRADALIIGKLLGKEILGYYSVGLLLATLPMEKISDIINQVAFPAFSSVQSQSGLAGQHFLKAVRVMSFFAFPILWGISSIAPEIIQIFLGSKWGAAAVPMQVIAIVIPVRMISNLLNPAVLGVGRPDISFYNSFVAFIIMPAAFLVGSMWGLLGVSLAWAIVFPIVFCINLSRVVRVLEIRFRDVFAAMQLPFSASLIMYFCVMLIKHMPVVDFQIIPKMAVLIGCGFVSYCLMTVLFNRRGLQEVRELVKV